MPTEFLPIRAVLFDLDDTLNDRGSSWRSYVGLLIDTDGGMLGPCNVDDVLTTIRVADRDGYRPKDELFAELHARLPWRIAVTADQLERHWREHFPRCMVTRAGVTDALVALHQRGIKIGIVTNGRADSQRAKIEAMGLRPLMDAVIVSESAGYKKPDERIFRQALEAIDVPASETLFVGDNPLLDVLGPARVGMRTAWLDLGGAYPSEFSRADFEFRSFESLGDIIDEASWRER